MKCKKAQAQALDIWLLYGISVLTYFLITLHTPSADALAEELGQRLIAKQIVSDGFPLTAYNSHASLEFQGINSDAAQKIEAEVAEWIFRKHSLLKKRRIQGKRQKQKLGMPTETEEEVVCIELRK